MLLSMDNAQSTIQHAMNIIGSTVKWQFALLNQDDTFINSRSVNDHLDCVQTVFRLLSRADVSLDLNGGFLFADGIKYLGHVIQP